MTGTAEITSIGLSDIFVQKMNQSPTGIIEIGKGIGLSAFPNPTNGQVRISLENPEKDVEIILRDAQGRTISSKWLNQLKSENINIEGAAGIYYLYVETPNGKGIIKLIKE